MNGDARKLLFWLLSALLLGLTALGGALYTSIDNRLDRLEGRTSSRLDRIEDRVENIQRENSRIEGIARRMEDIIRALGE